MKPWSYSSLTAFETCPHRYNLTRNRKVVKEAQGEAQKWGEWVHKQFENFVRDGTPLPSSIGQWQGIADKLAARPGEKLVEQQWAVGADFEPADWWESWARGVVDYGVVNGSEAILLDYKTGKRKPDSDQLKLFAALGFANLPGVERIKTGFAWLKDNKLDTDTFTREQVPVIWGEFLPRVRRLELAFERDKWPAKPSGLCREWCPCTRAHCEFSGRS